MYEKKIQLLGQKYFIYGHRKIKAALEQKQIHLTTSQTYRYMKKFNLLSESLKNPFLPKYGVKKTNSNKISHLPNLLNQNSNTQKPLEKLTTDISYLGKNLHLAAIMDLYNREIISYSLSAHPNLELVMKTINQLPTIINPCLFHSDQGTVFTSSTLQLLLKQKNLIASFSAPNRPDHNIWIENFFSNLKCETLYLLARKRKKITLENLKKIVDEYIFFYNHHRLSRPLNYQSPKTFLAKNLKN